MYRNCDVESHAFSCYMYMYFGSNCIYNRQKLHSLAHGITCKCTLLLLIQLFPNRSQIRCTCNTMVRQGADYTVGVEVRDPRAHELGESVLRVRTYSKPFICTMYKQPQRVRQDQLPHASSDPTPNHAQLCFSYSVNTFKNSMRKRRGPVVSTSNDCNTQIQDSLSSHALDFFHACGEGLGTRLHTYIIWGQLTPKLQASICSSNSTLAPTALMLLSAATCMNRWYLRLFRRLSIACRAPSSEWWFTRSDMWLKIRGRGTS